LRKLLEDVSAYSIETFSDRKAPAAYLQTADPAIV
jgi:hypothetical protein